MTENSLGYPTPRLSPLKSIISPAGKKTGVSPTEKSLIDLSLTKTGANTEDAAILNATEFTVEETNKRLIDIEVEHSHNFDTVSGWDSTESNVSGTISNENASINTRSDHDTACAVKSNAGVQVAHAPERKPKCTESLVDSMETADMNVVCRNAAISAGCEDSCVSVAVIETSGNQFETEREDTGGEYHKIAAPITSTGENIAERKRPMKRNIDTSAIDFVANKVAFDAPDAKRSKLDDAPSNDPLCNLEHNITNVTECRSTSTELR